jgi:hypothetical protein
MNKCGDSIEVMCPLFPEEDGGSIPTSPLQLRFEVVNVNTAAIAYRQWHYLSDVGFMSQINFGAYFNGILHGAVSYGPLSAPELTGYWDRSRKSQFGWYEIKRLAMSPDCPRNSESRFIGKTILLLRKRCVVKGIVTYADTAQGHVGTIYKATGFLNAGLTVARKDFRGRRNSKIEGRHRSQKYLFIKAFGEVQ